MQDVVFYGQQEGERVLYEIHSHPLLKWLQLGKIGLAGFLIIGLFGFIGTSLGTYTQLIWLIGLLIGLSIVGIGWLAVSLVSKNEKAFVTDRRIVRFSSVTPWTTNSRTLTWDEVVKIKTHSPSLILRMMNIGTVVVHARTTVLPGPITADNRNIEQTATNDDITLAGIEYYKDMGNYMDKILYLYKKEPEKLTSLRAFVPKPRGKRY